MLEMICAPFHLRGGGECAVAFLFRPEQQAHSCRLQLQTRLPVCALRQSPEVKYDSGHVFSLGSPLRNDRSYNDYCPIENTIYFIASCALLNGPEPPSQDINTSQPAPLCHL